MEPTRCILHVDMDAFFAAIEQRDEPAYRGKPILIGHDGPRGVVATASYEARQFGCHSAQPMMVARRCCPDAIVVRGRFDVYRDVSRHVFRILETFTPLVQPISIDEAFLDVTGSRRLHGPGVEIAQEIRQRIRSELSLTASVGVSFNKFLAKLASDLRKPNGLVTISPGEVQRTLDPLPIDRIWGIGPATAQRLRRIGIRTVAEARETDVGVLERHLGNGAARLQALCRGEDDRPVTPDQEAKSISHEQTFEIDVTDAACIRSIVLHQAEMVARRLRRKQLSARTVVLKLRYGDFETITRSKSVREPTDSTRRIQQSVIELYDTWASGSFRPVRLVGVGAMVCHDGKAFPSLFEDPNDHRDKRIDRAVDSIVDRFGTSIISRGCSVPRPDDGSTPECPPTT